MGYYLAGFDVWGVDIMDQPDYPFEFYRGDALNPHLPLDQFDAIHASPPCQSYSVSTKNRPNPLVPHPDLYVRTREFLQASGRPWVIENVTGAPYLSGVVLCGSMFGLTVRRHRNFETSFVIEDQPKCRHATQGPVLSVFGHEGSADQYRDALEINWSRDRDKLAEAIPPAYTRWIGDYLRDAVEEEA